MSDTPAKADDRVSDLTDGCYAAGKELYDMGCGGTSLLSDKAALAIHTKAITPALARHQQAVDELWAALEQVVRISDRKHQAWDAAHTALAAHRPLVTEKK